MWLSVIRRRTVLNPDSTAELLTVNSIENDERGDVEILCEL